MNTLTHDEMAVKQPLVNGVLHVAYDRFDIYISGQLVDHYHGTELEALAYRQQVMAEIEEYGWPDLETPIDELPDEYWKNGDIPPLRLATDDDPIPWQDEPFPVAGDPEEAEQANKIVARRSIARSMGATHLHQNCLVAYRQTNRFRGVEEVHWDGRKFGPWKFGYLDHMPEWAGVL